MPAGTITLRQTSVQAGLSGTSFVCKGSALTHDEIDSNFQFIQSGTGAVSETVQAALRKRKLYYSEYGAKIDSTTDDSTAFNNFVAACVAQNAVGVLDSGTSMIGAFTFTNAHNGLILEGPAFNPQVATAGLVPAVLKLKAAASTFLTFSTAYNITFRNIVIDGNGYADSVLYWPGTSATTKLRFERCGIYGATNATGITLNFAGTVEADAIDFVGCDFNGAPGASSIVPLHHIKNVNSNAYLIYFNNCRFANASRMFLYAAGGGSASFKNCQVFGATTRFWEITSTCKQFILEDVYTEQTAVPFLEQVGGASGTGYLPIQLINCNPNNSGATLTLNCQQPVILLGGAYNGNITITAKAVDGTQPVIDVGVTFTGTAAYAGSSIGTRLITLGGINSDGSLRAAQFKGSTTNDSAASGYVGEPLISTVARASAVSATGDSQWFDVTSVSIPSGGDWQITAKVSFILNGATSTFADGGWGSVTGNDGTGVLLGNTAAETVPPTTNADTSVCVVFRRSISASETAYLKARLAYSAGGPPKAYGSIEVRRMR